MVTWYLPPPFL